MELPPPTGAGPESTGIDGEQLYLFVAYEDEAFNLDPLEIAGAAVPVDEHVGPHRAHVLGHRPDRLHTSEHFGVRGDRLETDCRRRQQPTI